MSNWNDPAERQLAAYKLCDRLDKDTDPIGIRNTCLTDPKAARDALRVAGDFSNMPADLPVYVCEGNEQDRGKVVAIVLPPKGQMPTLPAFDIKKTWVCTWTPYVQLMEESAKPENK